MTGERSLQSLRNLQAAVERLREALAVPEDTPLIIDGTIQRFEFVIELFWKTLKHLLEDEGIHTTTPREAFQLAYQAEWLVDESAWLQMLRDRNETSHAYDEATARRIFTSIRKNFPEMARTLASLEKRVGQLE